MNQIAELKQTELGNLFASFLVMSALVILSDGAEEIEALTIVDVLKRADVSVTLGGLQNGELIKCAHDIYIKPDIALDSKEVSEKLFDAIIMPGGLGGSNAMAGSAVVGQLLKKHFEAGMYVAAICAAPIALNQHNIGHGRKLTSYPSFGDKLKANYTYCDDNVVVDDNLVTSRGPGTAFDFALKLAELMKGAATATKLRKDMLVK